MALAIGRATGKWFGSRATGPITASNLFTAIMFVANTAIITWNAIMIGNAIMTGTTTVKIGR